MDKQKIKAFVAACTVEGADDLPLLVFADYLEEQGDTVTGYALRWMVKHKRRPTFNEAYGCWVWYRRGYDELDPLTRGNLSRRRRMPYVECWLPEIVSRELSQRYTSRSRSWLALVRWLGWALERIRVLVN